MGNFKDAMNDFNVAKMVEFSLGGKRQIETELKMIGDRFERRIQRLSKHNDNNLGTFGKILDTFLLYASFYYMLLY